MPNLYVDTLKQLLVEAQRLARFAAANAQVQGTVLTGGDLHYISIPINGVVLVASAGNVALAVRLNNRPSTATIYADTRSNPSSTASWPIAQNGTLSTVLAPGQRLYVTSGSSVIINVETRELYVRRRAA